MAGGYRWSHSKDQLLASGNAKRLRARAKECKGIAESIASDSYQPGANKTKVGGSQSVTSNARARSLPKSRTVCGTERL